MRHSGRFACDEKVPECPKIYNEFSIFDVNDTIGKIREAKKIIEKTIDKNKIVRSTEKIDIRKITDFIVIKIKVIIKSKKPVFLKKFSPLQKFVIEALLSLSTEDSKFVSFMRIRKYYMSYYPTGDYKCANRLIKSQLTRLMNYNIVIQKRNSYALFDRDKVEEQMKEKNNKATTINQIAKT